MTTTREWESVLNIRLSDELKRQGLSSKPEVMYPGNRRMDVEVRIGPVVVAVEAEHGQSTAKRREAIGDADRRLQQGSAQCAVAVCYPDDTTEESLPTAEVLYAVRDETTKGTAADWNTADIDRLVSIIRLAPAQLGDPDAAAAALSESLDAAVRHLNDSQKQDLARALDLPRQTKDGRPTAHPWDAPAKRALLVVATAVMFHSRLDVHLAGMRPEMDNRENPPVPFTGDWPPGQAQHCRNAPAPIHSYLDSWNLILALDYKPIFETARAALNACPPDPAFAAAIRDTADAALVVAQNIASLRHDLLGRIFHTVLDTARYDGSFYTTTPAATLLATLAITEDMCDWSDPEAISGLRITDPACGTGTLLMAAAERIRDLSPAARDETLAADLIEQVLTGYDVNLTATHMAATTLGLLSPTTKFKNMKIGRAFLGVDNSGKAYLGSLEFLDQQPKLMPWPNAAQAVTQVDSGEAMAQSEPADLVIMNPPFTKHDLRHQQFSEAEKKKLKAREDSLFANKPVSLTSNSHTFLLLADYMNRSSRSSLASVLPLANATNTSASAIRRHLAAKYHVEIIVASYDHDRAFFSENTDISEMLLVLRRWQLSNGQKPPTKVINLAINPATPAAAFQLAEAIKDDAVTERGYGTVQLWPSSRIERGDWGGVRFLSPFLCDAFEQLENQEILATKKISQLCEVGPHGVGTRMTFNKSDFADKLGRNALWDHKANKITCMTATTDTFIVAKSKKEQAAANQWSKRGRLMLPERIRFNTARLVSVRLQESAVGSAWVVCKPNAKGLSQAQMEKAICAYLNSSVGILALLAIRSFKTISYPYFSLGDLKDLLIPAFDNIGKRSLSRLATGFDKCAESVMLPLPQMNQCPVRIALDEAVTEALGLDGETVATIRRQLSMEPSITGKRYAGPGG